MLLKPIEDLIKSFSSLPGIGRKTAKRLAFFLLENSDQIGTNICSAIIETQTIVGICSKCGFYSLNGENCSICSNSNRVKTLCIISKSQDLIAIENSNHFNGYYHILNGNISPLDGIGPSDLRISQLLERLEVEDISEIILALDSTVEGETTSQYLARIIDPKFKITRISAGIPFGGELEYTDGITIGRALTLRREFKDL
jgi:recombination protein RecR